MKTFNLARLSFENNLYEKLSTLSASIPELCARSGRKRKGRKRARVARESARAMLRKEERRGEFARSEPSRRTRAPLGRASWMDSCCWEVAVRVSGSKGRGVGDPSGRDIVAPQITQREHSSARALGETLHMAGCGYYG